MPIVSSNDPAGTQSIKRVIALLRHIGLHNDEGARLIDISEQLAMPRPTVHRMLKRLVAEQVLAVSPSRTYVLGPLLFELGVSAASRFDILDICQPSVERLAARTGDTIILTVRSGTDGLCVDRKQGAYPVKTFTVHIGMRRPLGVGAGSLAILSALRPDEATAIVASNASRLPDYEQLNEQKLLAMVAATRKRGYSVRDVCAVPGVKGVGVAAIDRAGVPVCALSVSAIASRLNASRQQEMAGVLREECDLILRNLEARPRRH